jgi:hypothetical protein
MYNLRVIITEPVSGHSREVTRQFDPTLPAATLQTDWNNLGPAVLGLVTALQADVSTVVPPPTL